MTTDYWEKAELFFRRSFRHCPHGPMASHVLITALLNSHREFLSKGSDGGSEYHGWLKVTGDEGKATITSHLSFNPRPEIAEHYDQQTGDRHRTIQDGLEHGRHSITNHRDGTGGKVESRVA